MKVLVTKFRHIGDVLLTTPLLRNLKLNFPDWQIDLAINRETAPVVALNPDINRLILYDRARIKSLPFWQRVKEEWRFFSQFKGYDIVINLTEGERGAIIAHLSKAPIRIGYPPKKGIFKKVYTHPLPPQRDRHTVDANLDPIPILGGEIKEKRVYIYWPEEAEEKVARLNLPPRFVHCHPVSRWLFKTPPPEQMGKIVTFIQRELNLPVVVTAAPSQRELEYINRLKGASKLPFIDLSGQLTLPEVAALNKKALFFVGVDTAVMHISAANDTPVYALFGPSGAFHWGPWDNNLMVSRYKNRNGIQQMGIHRVYQRDWECVPCGKDGCDGTKISRCLVELELARIFSDLKEFANGSD